jgi:anaerobic magnesium-protoporphyrin IX monomethyl ester cyclase
MSPRSRHVLLISPPLGRSQVGKVPMPPLGLATLAAVLVEDGHHVEILDCAAHGIDDAQLERELAGRRPEIVGVTGTTWTRYEQFRAARTSKRVLPNVPLVLGGPHVTFTARQTVERIPEVDFVVKGEGEVPCRRLVTSFDDPNALSDIPALAHRRGGAVVETTDVGFIEDLDTLPEPARHLLDIPAYRQTLFGKKATTVMTSRGCPVFCSFCSTSVMWGPRNRRRSPVKVVDEIEGLIDRYGLGAIWFFDDTLTLNRHHIVGILDEIERRRREFIWYCEIRANTVTRDLLKRMRALGCRYVSFGVESASPRIMKSIHKGITLPQVRNVLEWCSELNIYTKVFFIFGLPDETFDDGMETVRFIKEVRPRIGDVALAAGCSIMPGTEVERFAKARGLMPPDFDWTAEIYYPENRMNNRPIAVPTLFQPQMTLKDLNRLKFEYYGTGAVNWYNLKARIKAIRTPGDLWNLARLGGVFLGYLFRKIPFLGH